MKTSPTLPTPNQDEDKLDKIVVGLVSRAVGMGVRQNTVRDVLNSDYYPETLAALRTLLQEAEIRGMAQAKSRVLRRTEIPADAKEPTRDMVVILGEQIADIIDQDIQQLQTKNKKGE